ncbi:hypothetical protein EG329_008733, partial [Mollisiaceae sp. DMI_Dod_QoI]
EVMTRLGATLPDRIAANLYPSEILAIGMSNDTSLTVDNDKFSSDMQKEVVLLALAKDVIIESRLEVQQQGGDTGGYQGNFENWRNGSGHHAQGYADQSQNLSYPLASAPEYQEEQQGIQQRGNASGE